MLVTDDVLFIHVPKTGGMSVTDFLVQNLPGRKALTVPKGHGPPHPDVDLMTGSRHESLLQAAAWLTESGRTLSDFSRILAVIRNPYDLEVSRYHYLRLGRPWDAGPAQEIAMQGDFDRFCHEVGYPKGKNPGTPIERWYTMNGELPSNMWLLRLERLEADLLASVADLCSAHRPLRRLNHTAHEPWQAYVTRRNEQYIFEKYRWLFGFYDRATFNN